MKEITLSELDLDAEELAETPLDHFVTLDDDTLANGGDAESYKHAANTIPQVNNADTVNMSSIPEFRVKVSHCCVFVLYTSLYIYILQ